MPSFRRSIVEYAQSILGSLILFMVVRLFVIGMFAVISGSMQDTLLIGDFVMVTKVAYGATIPGTSARLPGIAKPKHRDVVVFWSNHDPSPTPLVKRLIGLPGDTVAMTNGVVSVNGVPQDEPYTLNPAQAEDTVFDERLLWQSKYLTTARAAKPYHPSRENWGPLIVPSASYFMMGDNRDVSYDSRWWGFVKWNEVIGRADVLYMSWNPDGAPFDVFHRIRWSRIGTSLRWKKN
jgi:signal peptidase I